MIYLNNLGKKYGLITYKQAMYSHQNARNSNIWTKSFTNPSKLPECTKKSFFVSIQ